MDGKGFPQDAVQRICDLIAIQQMSPDKSNHLKAVAIIPARGGSKGLPRKNIKDLCGKPLIAYSIEVALKSRFINRVIVSTEDAEIAEISKSFGAEVPFLRPKEIAEDNSILGDAINFTLRNLRAQDYHPDISITLYPTHPFRTVRLTDYLVQKMLNGHGNIITVKPVIADGFIYFTKDKDNHYTSKYISGINNDSHQSNTYYRSHGLFLGSNYFGCENPYVHIIDDPISLIDIDYPSDFYLAEEVIKQGLFDFGLN